MPSPISTGTRTVGLGRGILGDKAFEKEQRTGNRAAIVLGPGILGKKQSKKEVTTLEEVRTKPPAATDTLKVNVPVKKAVAPTKPTSAPKPKPKPPVTKAVTKVTEPPAPRVPKAAGGMTEVQARKLLSGDPDGWDKVLEVETKRPGGIRPAVARAIVALVPRITKNPIPDDMKAELERLAGAGPAGDSK